MRIATSLARNATAWNEHKRFIQQFLNDGLDDDPPGTYSRIELYRYEEMAAIAIKSWFVHCMNVSYFRFHKKGKAACSTKPLSTREIAVLIEVEPLLVELVELVPDSSRETLDFITDETAGLAITAVREYTMEMAQYTPKTEPTLEAKADQPLEPKTEPRRAKSSGTYRKPVALQRVS